MGNSTAHLSILYFFPDSLITISGSFVSSRFQSRLWIMRVIVVGELGAPEGLCLVPGFW